MSSDERSVDGMSPRRGASRSRSRSPTPHRRRSRSRSRRRSRSRSGGRSNGYESRRNRRSRSPMSSRRRHLGNRDDPEPSKCVGVFGISVYTTERQLQNIFDRFGPLDKVQVVLDAKTGRSRGFAFVYFANVKDAEAAKDECSGMEVDGRRIRVDYSITERAHTPTPGVYMGRPTNVDTGYRRDRPRHHRRSPSPPRYRRSRNDYHRYDDRRDYDSKHDRGYEGSKRSSYYDRSRSRSASPRRYRY